MKTSGSSAIATVKAPVLSPINSKVLAPTGIDEWTKPVARVKTSSLRGCFGVAGALSGRAAVIFWRSWALGRWGFGAGAGWAWESAAQATTATARRRWTFMEGSFRRDIPWARVGVGARGGGGDGASRVRPTL